jgi:hypothetical protein
MMDAIPMWPAVVIALVYGLWLLRHSIVAWIDRRVPDTERRPDRRNAQMMVLLERTRRARRIQGEESEQI